MARIDAFLKLGLAQGCSDIHLAVGVPPMLRLHGDLMPIKFRDLDDPGTSATCTTGETGGGCNCNTSAPSPAWLLALAALLPLRRRLSGARSAP